MENDRISILTNQNSNHLLFDLEDFDEVKRFTTYHNFRVANESDKYRMTVESFVTGDAGDSFAGHSGTQFSTKHQDNDKRTDGSCAQMFQGAWWYTDYHASNLNGLYLRDAHPKIYAQGVNW